MRQLKYRHGKSRVSLPELLLVVTLIGILSAFVLHKYIEMRHAAHILVLKGTKLSLEGATNLVYAKALIMGVDNQVSGTISINLDNPFSVEKRNSKPFTVSTRYGYPQGAWEDIMQITELDPAQWFYFNRPASSASLAMLYLWSKEGPGSIANCNISYQGAQKEGDNPTIIINETGC
ncbi:type II secretion system protein [Psychromonas antarctica]|uniref:type II secretion system protein n=1 Tax=Psychromonas antarctica TaxID=67573 RepID=UPI001EE953B5|nr:hypothetical protein [Psychromonas antarctica]MCG6199693.1 hypothetical protein [Psychromonas antarctica]